MSTQNQTEIYNILPPSPPDFQTNNNEQLTQQTQSTEPTSHTQDNINSIFLEGQFLYINDLRTRNMLVNAWNAITELDLWNYMNQDTISYMWSDDPEICSIIQKMEQLGYDGHSGASFGWTMRQMQYIAKNGERQYAQENILQET